MIYLSLLYSFFRTVWIFMVLGWHLMSHGLFLTSPVSLCYRKRLLGKPRFFTSSSGWICWIHLNPQISTKMCQEIPWLSCFHISHIMSYPSLVPQIVYKWFVTRPIVSWWIVSPLVFFAFHISLGFKYGPSQGLGARTSSLGRASIEARQVDFSCRKLLA